MTIYHRGRKRRAHRMHTIPPGDLRLTPAFRRIAYPRVAQAVAGWAAPRGIIRIKIEE